MTTDGRFALAARLLGAASLFAVGAIHLQQYQERYFAIPTIGTLFLLSFVGASVVLLGLEQGIPLQSGNRVRAEVRVEWNVRHRTRGYRKLSRPHGRLQQF